MAQKRPAHRPPHQPTDQQRRQVKALIAYGLTKGQIAEIIGITEKTLRKHYAHELRIGAAEAEAAMSNVIYQAGRNGSWKAALEFLKRRAPDRWSERRVMTGEGGGPIEVETSDAEVARSKLLTALDRMAENGDDADAAATHGDTVNAGEDQGSGDNVGDTA